MSELLNCECFNQLSYSPGQHIPGLHAEEQDVVCDAWKRLVDAVNDAAVSEAADFTLSAHLTWEDLEQIITLPDSIGTLNNVRRLGLYGSHLVRIPSAIGRMSSLEEIDPYTSYRLHWFPYEITQCRRLEESRVSTRALWSCPVSVDGIALGFQAAC